MSDSLHDEHLAFRAACMNALPFVRWDRAIPGEDFMDVYGWIDRDDGRCDFVLLTFFDSSHGKVPWWSTSSALYSKDIAEILAGNAETHNVCQRVSDVFGDRIGNRIQR